MAKHGWLLAGVTAVLGMASVAAAQEAAAPVSAIEAALAEANQIEAAPAGAPQAEGDALQAAAKPEVQNPNEGRVTKRPLPRFVSLKTGEGNARRGPGLTHRIDWVFTRVGMPLRITAEFEHWRRVEDQEGIGGWVHYSLLSGVRSVLVTQDMAQFRAIPDPNGSVVMQAEMGVVGKVVECIPDWCRITLDGEKGWVQKTALWGVDPGEVLE